MQADTIAQPDYISVCASAHESPIHEVSTDSFYGSASKVPASQ